MLGRPCPAVPRPPPGCVVDFRIEPELCVACLACVRVCPADAVAVEGQQVRIVDEACTRCVVETIEHEYPELIPYLAPVATPIAAEARYLKRMYGARTPIVYAGVCLTEGGTDVDAAVTFEDLRRLLERRGVSVAEQPLHF